MKIARLFPLACVLAIVAACAKKDPHAGHNHAAPAHEHQAPHGGTAVVLGKEA